MDTTRILKLRMSPEEIEKFQLYLMENCGLVFEGRRIQEMERAVAQRMIELGVSSFEDYHRYLTVRREGKDEINHLILSLTVGETQFFRTPDQFAALRKYILPELIERERRGTRELNILSAGCATGEEPYSLLILLKDLIPDLDSWQVRIAAGDINREFLETAREGVYGERKLRLVDQRTRDRFFERLGKSRWRVAPSLQKQIEWVHFNLTGDDYFPLTQGRQFHVILCRNVLIYFNLPNIQKVIASLNQGLLPYGYLILGYSETLFKISDLFQSIHSPEAFFYQKTPETPRRFIGLPDQPYPYGRDEILKALGSRPHPWVEKGELRTWAESGSSRGLLDLIARDQARGEKKPEAELWRGQAPEPAPAPEASRLVSAVGAPLGGEEAVSDSDEERMWESALELFAEERFEEAQKTFEDMLQANPRSARAHLGLGFLYANLGAEDRSREHIETARRYNDLLPEIYFLIALLDERVGEIEAAAENYQRVILLAPDFAMAHFNLGNLYLKERRHRDARREFGNTMEILARDADNCSLRFSGGLSREAIQSFCEMQREQIGTALPRRHKGR